MVVWCFPDTGSLELLSEPDVLARAAQAQADPAAGRQTTYVETAAEMDQRRQRERPGA